MAKKICSSFTPESSKKIFEHVKKNEERFIQLKEASEFPIQVDQEILSAERNNPAEFSEDENDEDDIFEE